MFEIVVMRIVMMNQYLHVRMPTTTRHLINLNRVRLNYGRRRNITPKLNPRIPKFYNFLLSKMMMMMGRILKRFKLER
jgi:hypothetical protein